MRVLFIGGSGIISSACSRLAAERDIDLFVLNRGLSPSWNPRRCATRSCSAPREGFVPLLGHPRTIGDVFHITSDGVLTWDQIAHALAASLDVSADIVHVPSDTIAAADPEWGAGLLGDKSHSRVFDNAKLRSVDLATGRSSVRARSARDRRGVRRRPRPPANRRAGRRGDGQADRDLPAALNPAGPAIRYCAEFGQHGYDEHQAREGAAGSAGRTESTSDRR